MNKIKKEPAAETSSTNNPTAASSKSSKMPSNSGKKKNASKNSLTVVPKQNTPKILPPRSVLGKQDTPAPRLRPPTGPQEPESLLPSSFGTLSPSSSNRCSGPLEIEPPTEGTITGLAGSEWEDVIANQVGSLTAASPSVRSMFNSHGFGGERYSSASTLHPSAYEHYVGPPKVLQQQVSHPPQAYYDYPGGTQFMPAYTIPPGYYYPESPRGTTQSSHPTIPLMVNGSTQSSHLLVTNRRDIKGNLYDHQRPPPDSNQEKESSLRVLNVVNSNISAGNHDNSKAKPTRRSYGLVNETNASPKPSPEPSSEKKERNRLSAIECRKRKKAYIQRLEQAVARYQVLHSKMVSYVPKNDPRTANLWREYDVLANFLL